MSTDPIKQLAEERRRRYEALSAAEKPKVALCAACGEPTYKQEVCRATGLFHDLEKKRIVGGSLVNGNVVKSSELMGAIDRTRVRWAPSTTQLVKADAQSLNIFQSFVAQMEWNLQRYGILYGRYDAATQTVEVHAVYEPEQHGNRFTFEIVDDPRIAVVDAIATELGLRRVGAICTHPPRDPDVCLLSAREMLLCAREQSRFGQECVLLTIAPSLAAPDDGAADNRDYPTSSVSASEPAGAPVIQCQAWQTSPHCVYLYRLGVLHEPTEADGSGDSGSSSSGGARVGHFSGRVGVATEAVVTAGGGGAPAASAAPPMSVPEEARYVASSIELEVAQDETDKNGARRFVTKAPSRRVDTRWFTSYIAVQQFESEVVRGLFMRISRPGMAPPTFQNLKNYFNDPKRKGASFAEKIADFHVLIFLAEIFSPRDDLPALARIAASRCMLDGAENYEAIVEHYMAQ